MEKKHVPYGPYEKYFKRPIDFCCGLAAVIVFSWLYLILIVLGAIFMRGNPFFTQDRPGKDEKVFKPMHMQPMYRMHGFVGRNGSMRAKTNAYIAGGVEDVGADIFQRDCVCPATTR